jgi:hypothetical protein
MDRNHSPDERPHESLDERELYGDPQHEETAVDRSKEVAYGDPQHEVVEETASDVELALWTRSSGPASVEPSPDRPSPASGGPGAGRKRPWSAGMPLADGVRPTRPTGRP